MAHQCGLNCGAAGCAIPNNARAKHAFEIFCHQEFSITSVTPATQPKKKPCSWIVVYKYVNNQQQYYNDNRAKRELDKIISRKPHDVSVRSKSVILNPPAYCVEYVTECQCKKPNFRKELTLPIMGLVQGIEDIKLEEIKLEESELENV